MNCVKIFSFSWRLVGPNGQFSNHFLDDLKLLVSLPDFY
jgi:hypothetical protein